VSARRFADQVVVVTGSSAGIGRSVAERFAGEGALVWVNGSRADRVERAVAEIIGSGGEAFGVVGDVSDSASVERNVAEIVERHGRIDILINNAGVVSNVGGPAEFYQDFDRVIGINLTGAFHWARLAAASSMIPRGKGAVVNVASLAGMLGIPNDVGYVASKAGLIGMTRALALDWAKHSIRVNCVAPGLTQSAMMSQYATDAPEQYAKFLANVPMGRLADPTEQADVMLFLASQEASYLTGVVINVDGGLMNVI
jgi:NAD(P)-dependent dehydrogenase (short-subunit alcohol dehydrogenase family)